MSVRTFDLMKDGSNLPGRHTPEHYEIRLAGELDRHWQAWFEGMAVLREGDGTTVVSGPIADQAALHGVLQRIRDLGVPLISITRMTDGSGGRRPTPGSSHTKGEQT